MSPARSTERRRGPIARSSSSPAWWPSESLSTFRWSTSRKYRASWRPSPSARADRVGQALEQQRAVGQPGERVVEGVVADPALDLERGHRAVEHVRDGAQEVQVAVAERRAGASCTRRACRPGRRPGRPCTMAPDTTPLLAQRAGAPERVVGQVVDDHRPGVALAAARRRTSSSRTPCPRTPRSSRGRRGRASARSAPPARARTASTPRPSVTATQAASSSTSSSGRRSASSPRRATADCWERRRASSAAAARSSWSSWPSEKATPSAPAISPSSSSTGATVHRYMVIVRISKRRVWPFSAAS